MTMYRTDENNCPAAFTTDIAIQAGLVLNSDYKFGTPFAAPGSGGAFTLHTAKLLGDPVSITIRVIDAVGYFTHTGQRRWEYIALPKFIWDALTQEEKRDVVGFHYRHEGGTAMRHLFPNYGKQ
jgi:hypothetical protein